MRAAAAALLKPDEPLPRFDELADRTDELRRHLRDLIPAVGSAARALPVGDGPRVAALLAVENVQARLSASPGSGLQSATLYTRSLARELRDLCDHHETLTGAPVRGLA